MTGDQVLAKHKQWVHICKSIAGDDNTEFNGATELIRGQRIEIARTKSEPSLIVGVFKIARQGETRYRVLTNKTYHEPIAVDRLDELTRSIYATLASQLSIPVLLAVVGEQTCLHGRN